MTKVGQAVRDLEKKLGKPIWEIDDQMHEPKFRALLGRNWGSDITPPEFVIDPEKTYLCNGKQVIGLSIELYNSCGREVTFPVKGTVVLRAKPYKTEYRIWTLDGRSSCMMENDKFDLNEW